MKRVILAEVIIWLISIQLCAQKATYDVKSIDSKQTQHNLQIFPTLGVINCLSKPAKFQGAKSADELIQFSAVKF